jgi:hypothetical protein
MANPKALALGASLALAIGSLALPALADEAEEQLRRASAGSCAEPRRFEAAAACADCPGAGSADRDGFSVAGPARARFSPTDVSATVADVPIAAPERGDFDGRGPCDTPGSCGATTGPLLPGAGGNGGGGGAGGGVSVVERPPKPSGPPGTNPPPRR